MLKTAPINTGVLSLQKQRQPRKRWLTAMLMVGAVRRFFTCCS